MRFSTLYLRSTDHRIFFLSVFVVRIDCVCLCFLNGQLASVIDATFQELPSAAGQFIDLQAYSSLVETHPMMLSQFTLNISSLIAEQTAARQGAA
mmetsp:Transcript_35575/g.72495  ORF Transcript_35575/g.72495 Transcript_35575/m.72495 type:complete len:95 (-) Transcript_35575:229-513(-)